MDGWLGAWGREGGRKTKLLVAALRGSTVRVRAGIYEYLWLKLASHARSHPFPQAGATLARRSAPAGASFGGTAAAAAPVTARAAAVPAAKAGAGAARGFAATAGANTRSLFSST